MFTRELRYPGTYMKSFTKVLDSMAQVGAALPHFKVYAHLFAENKPIQRILGLFFRDILDFHSTALKFFQMKRMHANLSYCQVILTRYYRFESILGIVLAKILEQISNNSQ